MPLYKAWFLIHLKKMTTAAEFSARNYSRMNLKDLAVQISIYNEAKKDYDASIDNICLGGISILSEAQFVKDSIILVSLNPLTKNYVHGKVKWFETVPQKNQIKYGVEFLLENNEETKLVADFIHTLLNMLTKEKVIAKTLDLFCASVSKNNKFSR